MTIRLTQISLLAALLFAGTTALAQRPATQQPSQPQDTVQPAGGPDGGMTSNNNSTPNFADQSFVEDTLKSNQVQVQASQLAQQKASSGDVKEFSQRMIQIHTQLTTQLTPLAKHLQISPDQKPSKKEREELAKLDQLSGTDFDAAYMQIMAKEQQHTLKQFKRNESASSPYIQKVTKADDPVLNQDYQILQKIAQTHNIPLDAKD
ncbi:MAG: DUF4142 domain-containing protein [Acidobacteriaceae bacterium]